MPFERVETSSNPLVTTEFTRGAKPFLIVIEGTGGTAKLECRRDDGSVWHTQLTVDNTGTAQIVGCSSLLYRVTFSSAGGEAYVEDIIYPRTTFER